MNLNHLDCLSPPDPQQEFKFETSWVPNPADEVDWLKVEEVQRVAAVAQSWPATGGGVVLFTQDVKVPVEPVDEIV